MAAALATAVSAIASAEEPAKDQAIEDQAIVVQPIDIEAGEDARGGPAHRDGERALDEPAFVTRVHIDERSGETTSVAEVLAKGVGVQVRSLGGLGGFSSVSIRGAAPGQTTVLVDGIPLSRLASVTADLGRLELQSFSEIDVYRGGAPASFGGASIGGAVNVVTRLDPIDDENLLVSIGGGSFATRHARARYIGATEAGRLVYHLGTTYRGTAGNYSYFNDNGTNLDRTDDAFVTRTNNAFDQLGALARIRYRDGDNELRAGLRISGKDQGIPGPGNIQSNSADLRTLGQLLDLAYLRQRFLGRSNMSAELNGYATSEVQRYRDLDGEIGLAAQNRRYTTVAGGGAGTVRAAIGSHHVLSAMLDGRFDWFKQKDVDGMVSALRNDGRRWGVGVAVADEVFVGDADRVVLRPSLRFDVQQTIPLVDLNAAMANDLATRTDLYPSPRLSARIRLVQGLAAKANAGWYFRAPTLLELFGDRGFVVGNPDLDPETGLSADVGLVWSPQAGIGVLDRIFVESAAFMTRAVDTISLVANAGSFIGARNLGESLILGSESSVAFRIDRLVTITTNYTFMASEQTGGLMSFEGKALPNRPRHELYARADVVRRQWKRQFTAWLDGAVVSGNFVDSANLVELPRRVFVGAGVKAEVLPQITVGLEGKNLFDEQVESIELDPPPRPDLTSTPRAVADFYGYPLPGRAFYLTMEWAH